MGRNPSRPGVCDYETHSSLDVTCILLHRFIDAGTIYLRVRPYLLDFSSPFFSYPLSFPIPVCFWECNHIHIPLLQGQHGSTIVKFLVCFHNPIWVLKKDSKIQPMFVMCYSGAKNFIFFVLSCSILRYLLLFTLLLSFSLLFLYLSFFLFSHMFFPASTLPMGLLNLTELQQDHCN